MGDDETTRRRRVEVFVEASLNEDDWLEVRGEVEHFISILMDGYELRELRYRFEHTLRDEKGKVYA